MRVIIFSMLIAVSSMAVAQDLPSKFFTDGKTTLEARQAVVKAAKGEVVYQCTQKELSDKGTLVNKKAR